jgi:hypothetical protein
VDLEEQTTIRPDDDSVGNEILSNLRAVHDSEVDAFVVEPLADERAHA